MIHDREQEQLEAQRRALRDQVAQALAFNAQRTVRSLIEQRFLEAVRAFDERHREART